MVCNQAVTGAASLRSTITMCEEVIDHSISNQITKDNKEYGGVVYCSHRSTGPETRADLWKEMICTTMAASSLSTYIIYHKNS